MTIIRVFSFILMDMLRGISDMVFGMCMACLRRSRVRYGHAVLLYQEALSHVDTGAHPVFIQAA